MSIGIVLVTHDSIGESLLRAAEFILGEALPGVRFVPFHQLADRATTADEVAAALDEVDAGDGVLVLTDLIGSSPSNLVGRLLDDRDAVMVTGLNLAMLMSAWNYRHQPLGLAVRKAVDGGRRGVKIFQE
jgi:PTS system ascorbate-specific IIA component